MPPCKSARGHQDWYRDGKLEEFDHENPMCTSKQLSPEAVFELIEEARSAMDSERVKQIMEDHYYNH